jgi:hypothetical protein
MTGITSATNNTAVGSYAGQQTSSGAHNTYIGYKAGRYLTTDNYNTVLGYSALGSANTRTGETAYNVAIGAFAGDAVTSANNLTLIGYAAGGANTTGTENVFVGNNSGSANTTGSRNIALGYAALDGADTESDNIAIGKDALGGAVAGGEKNVVIGNYAGDAVTSADGSVMLGHQSGTAVSTGAFNTLVGYQTGQQISSGIGNTFLGYTAGSFGNHQYSIGIGYGAMQNADNTGDHNIAIGSWAMQNGAMTGDYNVGVGYKAGYNLAAAAHKNITVGYHSGDNITTGDFNVIIGGGDAASATGDSQLLISSGDGGVSWITGDSAGKVQIGSLTSPVTTGMLTVARDDTTATGPTLLLLDGDDDANAGPTIKLYRDSASPADGDALGNIGFNGEDSAGGERTYAAIKAIAKDVTSGTNDGILEFKTMVAGTQTVNMEIEDGAITISEAYTLPTTVTGANDRVLTAQTDGSTAWAAAVAESSFTDGAELIDIPGGCYLEKLFPYGSGSQQFGNPFTTYVQYFPFIAPASGNVSKLGIRCNTYAGDTDIQIGIYTDVNGTPTALMGKVEVSIDSAAVFDSTLLSATTTLVKGVQYWCGYMVDDSTVNNSLYGAHGDNYPIVYTGQNAGNQTWRKNVRSNNLATSLPATPTSVSGYWTGQLPQIYCEI